ncbi:MAG: cell division protein FtsQ/DivIB [Eubacteriales bacterium]
MNTFAFSGKPDKDKQLTNAERVSNDTFERLREINRIRQTRRTMFSLLFAAVVCIIFAVGCVSLFFKVSTVLVEGVTGYDKDAIRDASGILQDQNLYALDKAAIEKSVITNYPYIRNVRVDRRIPTTVALIVEEDEPHYYFELAGEYFVLSDTLRVMEYTEDVAELLIRKPNIIKLNTQRIIYAVVGRQIKFENSDYFEYAQEMLATFLGSELSDKISIIDFSDKFNIFIMYDGRFKIEFGNIENIAIKIDFASRILNSFDSTYSGTINVENEEAFVIIS